MVACVVGNGFCLPPGIWRHALMENMADVLSWTEPLTRSASFVSVH